MKKIFAVIFLLHFYIFSQYTTPNTNVNWTLDSLVIYSGGIVTGTFPNYLINNLVIISNNDLVKVIAGSKVNFSSTNAGFEIRGIFQANGNAQSTILFSSQTQDSLGAYNGFYFVDSSIDSLCFLNWTKIEFAYYGIRATSASPKIENSHLYKCRRGIQLSSSDAKIYNNIIERSYEYGITMTLGSNPIIIGNTLANNNTQNTSAKNQISIGLQGNNSPIIKNNVIYGSTSIKTGAISLWVSSASNFSNTIIEGNTIYNNSFGITLLNSGDGIINAVIRNNNIFNNNINPDVNTSGSGININGTSPNKPVISGNNIYGNWWGISIQNGTTVQAGPQPNLGDLSNSDTTDDGKNKIYNNVQSSNTYDVYNNCTNDIKAQNNDWNVYDSTAIAQHIFDKVDDPQRGLINFIPFLNPTIPVELTSFNAIIENSNVLLNWSTSSEKNNKGFEVERNKLINGNYISSSWASIGFVSGNGTTTENQVYSFNDKNIEFGKYSYRLKQIDYNGSFKYSKESEVEILNLKEFKLFQNYPNPFYSKSDFSKQASTEIVFQLNVDTYVTLKIYDVLGKEVALLINNEWKKSGKYNYSLLINNYSLPSGIYYYQLKAGEYVESKKMLLIK